MNGKRAWSRPCVAALAIVLALAAVYLVVRWKPGAGGSQKVRQTLSEANRVQGQVSPVTQPIESAPEPHAPDLKAALEAEAAASSEPIWGAFIGGIQPGSHRYWFCLDGRQIADPANPVHGATDLESVFQWPLKPQEGSSATIPRALEGGGAAFVYRGAIERSLLFIAPMRGEWWGIDEFEPLNAAARANLERILADRSLATVEGIVTDSNQRPIAGARVRLSVESRSIEGAGHIQTVACNAQGRFLIGRIRSARVQARVRAAGFVEAFEGPFDTPAGGIHIVLGATTLLTGTVRTESGQPVPYAKILARTFPGDHPDLFRAETRADASGRFVFENLKPHTYFIAAQADGYAPVRKGGNVVPRAGEGPAPHVDLVMPTGITVKGRAIQRTPDGREGRGLEGVDMAIYMWLPASDRFETPPGIDGSATRLFRTLRSGPNGEFAINGLVAGTGLRIDARYGRLQAEDRIHSRVEHRQPQPEIKIHFPPSGRVRGRVVDAEKRPVPGASVGLISVTPVRPNPYQDSNRAPFNRGAPADFVTDADGRFEIDEVEAGGLCRLLVRAAGFAWGSAYLRAMDSPIEEEIVLSRSASISGRVVETGTEKPLAGMQIHGALEDVRTREDGTFELTTLHAGECSLGARGTANGQSYVSETSVTVQVGEGESIKDVLIRARPAATIKGVVLSRRERKPQAEVLVSCPASPKPHADIMNRTGFDGTFALSGLVAGEVTLSAKRGYHQSEPKNVTVGWGQTVVGVELLMPETTVITGMVLDVDGSAARDVPLVVYCYYAAAFGTSGADGRFTIECDQIASYVFRDDAKAQVHAQLRGNDERYGASAPFRLYEDKPTTDVIIRLNKGGHISGMIRDDSGEPLSGTYVSVQTQYPYMSGRSDGSGRYDIFRVPPGEHSVSPYFRGYDVTASKRTGKVNVEAGRETGDIDFVLRKTKQNEESKIKFRGKLLDIHGNPLSGWQIRVVPQDSRRPDGLPTNARYAATARDGTFVLRELSTVHYRLELTASSFAPAVTALPTNFFATERFDIPAEPQSPVSILLPVGATMKGRFVTGDLRQPVANATVTVRLSGMGAVHDHRGNPTYLPIPPNVPDGQPWLTHFSYDYRIRPRDNGAFEARLLPVDVFDVTIDSPTTLRHELKNVMPNDQYVFDLGEVVLKPRPIEEAGGIRALQNSRDRPR